MPNKSLRASQFLAFDALKGFQEILKDQEKIKEKRKVLSEEEELEMNQKLIKLKKGDYVEITYYWMSKYITIKGMITKIDVYQKQFTILNRKIPFQDLIQLKALEK